MPENDSPQPLRLGIIGLGRAFSLMEPCLAHDPRIHIAAGTDPRKEAREFFERHYDAKTYASAEELCKNPDLDAVYISSPHQYHRHHVELAMRNGKHALVEKPMALSLHDCEAMIEAAHKAQRVMIIGHSHSFDLPIKRSAELIASQQYGAVKMIHALQYTDFLYRPRRPEELDTSRGGGVIFNQAPHQIDIIRLLGGGRVASVRAMIGRWDETRPTEGAYSALLTFENGAFASLTYSGYAHFDSDEWNEWIGESGQSKNPDHYGAARSKLSAIGHQSEEIALKNDYNYGGQKYSSPLSTQTENSPWHQHFGSLIISCTKADLRPMPHKIMIYNDKQRQSLDLPRPIVQRSEVIDELYNAIRHNKPALHDGEWALATMEVCFALLQSAQSQSEIRMTKQKACY